MKTQEPQLFCTVSKEFEFDAAHQLTNYPGKCGSVHGHRYRLVVGIRSPLHSDGMCVDFSVIKDTVEGVIIRNVDHAFIVDDQQYEQYFEVLGKAQRFFNMHIRTTAENMAYMFMSMLFPYMDNISYIEVHETPTSKAVLYVEDYVNIRG